MMTLFFLLYRCGEGLVSLSGTIGASVQKMPPPAHLHDPQRKRVRAENEGRREPKLKTLTHPEKEKSESYSKKFKEI